jgi:hypothetical protein
MSLNNFADNPCRLEKRFAVSWAQMNSEPTTHLTRRRHY